MRGEGLVYAENKDEVKKQFARALSLGLSLSEQAESATLRERLIWRV
jgi:hypothetical protein